MLGIELVIPVPEPLKRNLINGNLSSSLFHLLLNNYNLFAFCHTKYLRCGYMLTLLILGSIIVGVAVAIAIVVRATTRTQRVLEEGSEKSW